MTSFNDMQGRTWHLRLDVAAVRRVRTQAQVDLLKMDDEQTLSRIVYDPMGLAATLWAIVEPDARSRDVDEESFASGLGGDTLDAATTALIEAITGFFRPAQRRVLGAAWARLNEAETKAADELVSQIATAELQLPTTGRPSTSSPASSGSIPTP